MIMSTFPPNYDKRHWTLHSDLFILIIKTMGPWWRHLFFLPAIHPTAPCFFHANTQFLRRFGLCGFLCRLSKGPEVFPGGSWGIFATSFESKNGEYWFGKGTWLSQLCCESGGGICHEVYGFFRNSFCGNQNPFCCAVQQESLRKHEVLLCFTGSECHVMKKIGTAKDVDG